MFNAATKTYFTIAAVAVATAFGSVLVTHDRSAFSALLAAGLVLAALGVAAHGFVPAEPPPEAGAAEAVHPVDTTDVVAASPWGFLGALALVVLALGAALGGSLVVLGLIASVIVGAGWLAQVWREHPSWTPAMTERLSDRFIVPIGLPGTIIVFVGIGVISLSRLMLAVSKNAAALGAAVISLLVLAAAWALSTRPHLGRRALGALVAVSSTLVIASGVAGALRGEREFHHAGEEGILVRARDLSFSIKELSLVAEADVTLTLENHDGVVHTFSLYDMPGGEPLFRSERVPAGEEEQFEFKAPRPGTYHFQCDIHRTVMTGIVTVKAPSSTDT